VGLTVLNVAYPFAPVGPDTTGGAEQVLSHIDQALVRAGHRSIVIASEGSQTAGTLISVPRPMGLLDDEAIETARAWNRRAIESALERWPVDIVHLHGVDFHTYLPPAGVPVLATLHLPVTWYGPEALYPQRPATWLNCVSHSQHATCAPNPYLLAPIENGVPGRFLTSRHAKRNFALMLARICPEKGVHLAIEAAKQAGISLLIAGEVYPYGAHQHYFRAEVEPRLDRRRRFIGSVGFARKCRLLAATRCLLVPSLVPETSSLVVREALASGTPAIAFALGALVETIEHGRTGFLVRDVREMAQAIARSGEISAEACRATARRRFSIDRMTSRYMAAYQALCRARSDYSVLGAA
jgi:glycosyltransferase involved in cell wall biosynthesis